VPDPGEFCIVYILYRMCTIVRIYSTKIIDFWFPAVRAGAVVAAAVVAAAGAVAAGVVAAAVGG
jgi:hypothetical protein